MSRRNSRESKARRRAERERQRRSTTSGEGPRAVEVQAALYGQPVLVPGTQMNTVPGYAPTPEAA